MTRPLLSLLLALVACASDGPVPVPETGAESITAPTGPAPPEEVTGQLISGDETLESGEFMDRHEVLVREGQWIRAELISGDFDPYIIVLSPTGTQTDVDDSQEGNLTASKAVVRATESGEWTVVVTTFKPGEAGNYTLTYEVTDTAPSDAKEGRQIDPPAGEEHDDTQI